MATGTSGRGRSKSAAVGRAPAPTHERTEREAHPPCGGLADPCPPCLADHDGSPEERPQAQEPSSRWTLAVVCLATSLLLLNVAAPNVALPEIGRRLGASFAEVQWVISAYALLLAATLLSAGALADLVGRRRMFLSGLGLFAVASAACALAPSVLVLIVARGVQGLSGAILFSSSLAVLAETFSGRARGRALGFWGATIAVAFAIGPLEGGLLIEALGWRAIFWANVLLAVPALVVARRHLAESRDPDATSVDWAGTATLSFGVLGVVFALVQGNELGWGSPAVLIAVIGGAALLGAFVVVERRAAHPMLDLRLFRVPTFVAASVGAFVSAIALFGSVLFITLFLLNVRGSSPISVGLQLLPFASVSFAASILGSRYGWRVPVRTRLVTGLALIAGGALLMRGLSADSSWTALLPGLVAAGAGAGIANPALAYTALGVVPAAHSGAASGINNTFRQLGLSAGIAGLGAIVQASVESGVDERLAASGGPPASPELGELAAEGALGTALERAPGALQSTLLDAYGAAYADALNQVFAIGFGAAALGAIVALLLVRNRDFVSTAR